jgi:ferric-dicitrate binding protein FerR (iron transport regulator)
MTWLEPPQDKAEQLLREALDQAALRAGDQITHRRVWTKITEAVEQPQPRRLGRLVLAGAALTLVAGASIFLASRLTSTTSPKVVHTPTQRTAPNATNLIEPVREPGQVVGTRAGERARIALGRGAEAELAPNSSITWDSQHRPSIQAGSAMLTVPHQPPGWHFSVTAGPYVVTVVGTKFEVHVDNSIVGVEVSEGVVEVWHGDHSTRLAAGDSWRGPYNPVEAQPEAVAPVEKPRARTRLALRRPIKGATMSGRGLRDVQAVLRAGDTNKAIDMLNRIAAGSGPKAENAAYEIGRITRYSLNRPRQAVTLWDRYRSRFPNGLLRTEADLSILDTLSSIGDVPAALEEAEAFLARHPGSERRGEVQQLAERLRAAGPAAGSR